MKRIKLMQGDNMKSLDLIPDNSIDSVVTDPPYGLKFMGKTWDYDVPSVEFWKKIYQKLKPGGHILSFGGTRTYHRMVVNIEDAGFEIRDQIQWIYGSGFPKSHNIGKAVDKLEGNDREVIGKRWELSRDGVKRNPKNHNDEETQTIKNMAIPSWDIEVTKGTSPYEGWGTALKPANEPICVARKPLSEKSVAENVLKWGTGGINVDGCRVGSDTIKSVYGGFTNALVDGRDEDTRKEWIENSKKENGQFNTNENEGRFPANIILECICDEVIKGEKGEIVEHSGSGGICNEGTKEPVGRTYNDKADTHTDPNCPCRLLDEQTGYLKSGEVKPHHKKNKTANGYQGSCYGKFQNEDTTLKGYGDGGGASRFFYQAKVSKAERNMGLDGFEDKGKGWSNHLPSTTNGTSDVIYERSTTTKNTHPTVKPINLMSYLCRLITPEGGIVLDPFMGSGSTGIAAQLEGFRFVGMEMDEDYFKIASARIDSYEKYNKFIK